MFAVALFCAADVQLGQNSIRVYMMFCYSIQCSSTDGAGEKARCSSGVYYTPVNSIFCIGVVCSLTPTTPVHIDYVCCRSTSSTLLFGREKEQMLKQITFEGGANAMITNTKQMENGCKGVEHSVSR